MISPAEKAARFRALHERPGAFIIPNPWDAGTARLLASLGFEALATTSLGLANSLGRVDGTNSVSRAEVIENCRVIATATDLPVNADLENGYADEPRAAAEWWRARCPTCGPRSACRARRPRVPSPRRSRRRWPAPRRPAPGPPTPSRC